MKCKECKNEMVEYHRCKHVEFLEIRYRCEVCGWETFDAIDLKPKAEGGLVPKDFDGVLIEPHTTKVKKDKPQ